MLNKKERKYKKYLQVRKRLNEVWKIKRQLPWRELEKPEHAGWTISFTLSPGGMHKADSEKWLQVIAACDRGFHLRKDNSKIINKLRSGKRFDDIKPLFTYRRPDGTVSYGGPHLSSLSEKEYTALPEILQRARFFEERIITNNSRWGGVIYTYKTYHHRIPESLLSIKVRQRFYTHIRDINPVLEREESYLRYKEEEYREIGGHRYLEYKIPRKHIKDALKHLQRGDITDLTDHHKLNNRK